MSTVPAVSPEALRRAYLDLLKGCLAGTVHQEVFVVQGQPAELTLDPATHDSLRQHGVRLVKPGGESERRAMEEGRVWPMVGETMVGRARLDNLERCVAEVVRDGVPGDVIEAGVWRGGASIFLRAALDVNGGHDRRVWVADSFKGLPEPDADRYPADRGNTAYMFPQLAVSLEEVRSNFRRYGVLDEDRVRFVRGFFRDTLPGLAGERWSIVRLDGDLYESTMDGLVHLYPHLAVGGWLVIDDYGALPNAKAAVEDFRREHGITEPLQHVDWTGVCWRRES